MTEKEMEWVPIASFSRLFEADLAISQLESEGIPSVLRRGDTTGIFGPGFGGPLPNAFSVLVPPDRAEEARQLLVPVDDSPA